ncbi:MAG: DNA translocase FtsK 4TM domain-containing protein, partial [Candidatus Omnitrophica bacterium]|nr:DNA translocase FtsK 4TM domain-containing protein [Candidatus Omnitrophota bacterium]
MLLGACGLFSALALLSYHPADLDVLSSEPNRPLTNIGGIIGAWLAFVGRGGFGWASLLVPVLCALWAVRLWQAKFAKGRWTVRLIASLCLLQGLSTMAALTVSDATGQAQAGGAWGYVLGLAGQYYLGSAGTWIIAGCVSLLSWVLVSDGSTLSRPILAALARLGSALSALRQRAGRVSHPRDARPAAERSATPPVSVTVSPAV